MRSSGTQSGQRFKILTFSFTLPLVLLSTSWPHLIHRGSLAYCVFRRTLNQCFCISINYRELIFPLHRSHLWMLWRDAASPIECQCVPSGLDVYLETATPLLAGIVGQTLSREQVDPLQFAVAIKLQMGANCARCLAGAIVLSISNRHFSFF